MPCIKQLGIFDLPDLFSISNSLTANHDILNLIQIYVQLCCPKGRTFNKTKLILEPEFDRLLVGNKIVGSTNEPVLIAEIIFHELWETGSFIDSQICESPAPYKVTLSIEYLCSWGLVWCYECTLAKVVLNRGHVFSKIRSKLYVVKISIFCLWFNKIKDRLITVMCLQIFFGSDVVVAGDQCWLNRNSFWTPKYL